MLKAYWETRTIREKRLAMIASGVFIIMLLYFVVWSPLNTRAENLKEQVTQQQTLLSWMQKTVPIIMAQRGKSTQATTGELFTVVEAQFKANPNMNISRISEKQVRVNFKEVAFNDLLKHLLILRKQANIQVQELQANRMLSEGMVEGHVVLAQ